MTLLPSSSRIVKEIEKQFQNDPEILDTLKKLIKKLDGESETIAQTDSTFTSHSTSASTSHSTSASVSPNLTFSEPTQLTIQEPINYENTNQDSLKLEEFLKEEIKMIDIKYSELLKNQREKLDNFQKQFEEERKKNEEERRKNEEEMRKNEEERKKNEDEIMCLKNKVLVLEKKTHNVSLNRDVQSEIEKIVNEKLETMNEIVNKTIESNRDEVKKLKEEVHGDYGVKFVEKLKKKIESLENKIETELDDILRTYNIRFEGIIARQDRCDERLKKVEEKNDVMVLSQEMNLSAIISSKTELMKKKVDTLKEMTSLMAKEINTLIPQPTFTVSNSQKIPISFCFDFRQTGNSFAELLKRSVDTKYFDLIEYPDVYSPQSPEIRARPNDTAVFFTISATDRWVDELHKGKFESIFSQFKGRVVLIILSTVEPKGVLSFEWKGKKVNLMQIQINTRAGIIDIDGSSKSFRSFLFRVYPDIERLYHDKIQGQSQSESNSTFMSKYTSLSQKYESN